jgi:hypothetical protein
MPFLALDLSTPILMLNKKFEEEGDRSLPHLKDSEI